MTKTNDVDIEVLLASLVDKMRPCYLQANRASADRADWKDKGEECRTQQHFKEQLDINNIVKQYVAQGYKSSDFDYMATQVYSDASRFLDISQVNDVFDASKLMNEAQDTFIRNIPARIRARFNHDPIAFYKFVSSPSNAGAVRQMFSDLRNYAVPTAEQLQEGSQKPVVEQKSKDTE